MLRARCVKPSWELVAQFADINTRLSNVMKMKKADIIPNWISRSFRSERRRVPVFTAKYGSVNNQYALKVDRMNQPALKSFQ